MMSASEIGLRRCGLRLFAPAAESGDDLARVVRLRQPLGQCCVVEHIRECGEDAQMLV
jgi:hypothetical protein